MDLGFHSSVLRRPVHPHPVAMGRPLNTSLTAWEFAEKVVKYALDRGRPVAVYRYKNTLLTALHGTPTYDQVVKLKSLVGVYDADCLVRDLRDDVKEYFKT